jgi:uncharacterized protein (TIGR03435 family)
MILRRIIATVSVFCIGITGAAQEPSYEAAVLKRNVSGESGQIIDTQGQRFTARNVTMRTLILNAYRPRSTQLTGAPTWVETDRYDLIATLPTGTPQDVGSAMLRQLLRERAGLIAHYEDREQDVYLLTLDRTDRRLGPSMRVSPRDCGAVEAARVAGQPPIRLPDADNGAPPCGILSNGGEFLAGGITMDNLARNLGSRAGRIVIDRTALPGYYQLTLKYDASRDGSTASPDVPSLFTALREQLGLRLEPGRAPIQALVIDHIERPSEN